ncbi:hypothetical protein HK100_003434 [Physocladia obscura]|uniref:Methyltransferase domain-containing protein n=1 Tax=Physocladia obscura TaxID=109957 RepID=A0AAD5XAG4_9FUNG|nr:hypothetical protein HK100_003434 [Physocladia obscura]
MSDSSSSSSKQPGRRPKPPPENESKRASQMRKAQQAHNQRRREYIKSLEQKLAQYEAIDFDLQETENKTLKNVVETLVAKNFQLEQALRNSRQAYSQLIETFQIDIPDPIVATSWTNAPESLLLNTESDVAYESALQITANERVNSFSRCESTFLDQIMIFFPTLYELPEIPKHRHRNVTALCGPWQNVEILREQLQKIPSLVDFYRPDFVFDLIMALGDVIGFADIKLLTLHLTAFKDACKTIIERQQIVELVEDFHVLNALHFAHFYASDEPKFLAKFDILTPHTEFAPQMRSVRQSMIEIPSLEKEQNLVDDLCAQFSMQCGTDDEFSGDKIFYRVMELQRILRMKCHSREDLTKFMVFCEVAREANRKVVQKMGTQNSKMTRKLSSKMDSGGATKSTATTREAKNGWERSSSALSGHSSSIAGSSASIAALVQIKPETSFDERNIDRVYFPVENSGNFLPNDIEDQERLELQHYMLRHAFKGDVINAEIKKLLKTSSVKALDVGCGRGWWLDSVMKLYPAPKYFGVDIAESELSAAAGHLPGSITLDSANVLKGLPYAESTFDFVHQRLLIMSLTKDEFPVAIKELIRVTKSGGWIELLEFLVVHTIAEKYKRDVFTGTNLEYYLRIALQNDASTRATNIQKKVVSLPLGWGGSMGELHSMDGKKYLLDHEDTIRQAMGVEKDEYNMLVEKRNEEFKDFKAFMSLISTYY